MFRFVSQRMSVEWEWGENNSSRHLRFIFGIYDMRNHFTYVLHHTRITTTHTKLWMKSDLFPFFIDSKFQTLWLRSFAEQTATATTPKTVENAADVFLVFLSFFGARNHQKLIFLYRVSCIVFARRQHTLDMYYSQFTSHRRRWNGESIWLSADALCVSVCLLCSVHENWVDSEYGST